MSENIGTKMIDPMAVSCTWRNELICRAVITGEVHAISPAPVIFNSPTIISLFLSAILKATGQFMLKIQRMFCSMINNRISKWLLLLLLFLVLLSVHQFLIGNQSSLNAEITSSTCLNDNGMLCDTPKRTTTRMPEVTKKTNKKPVKDPNLKKVHIIPNFGKTNVISDITKSQTTLPRKVLIVSYFDSGPPHIGEILSHHSDLFYLNEPLRPFDSTSLKDGEEPISRRSISEAMDYLSDLFDCKILNSKFGYSEKMVQKLSRRSFAICRDDHHGNVSECVQELCKSKPVVMAKTIRIYLQDVQSFLMRYKGLVKVIILQRDPRVNLHMRNKRSHPGWTTGSDMFFQGRSLCARMLHDVQNARRLEGSGHGNFYRIVLYEHFLKNPESILRGILSFIGVTSSVEDVRKLMKSANAFKQFHKMRVNRWEWIPDDEAGVNVDRGCAFFYKSSLYNPMMQSPGIVQRYNLCQYCD